MRSRFSVSTRRASSIIAVCAFFSACLPRPESTSGGVGGGSRLSEIRLGLPEKAKFSEKAELQAKLSGYSLSITPEQGSSPDCTTVVAQVKEWAAATIQNKIRQGCSYRIDVSLGQYTATLASPVPSTSPSPQVSPLPSVSPQPSPIASPAPSLVPSPGAPVPTAAPAPTTAPAPASNGPRLSPVWYVGTATLTKESIGTLASVSVSLTVKLTQEGRLAGFTGGSVELPNPPPNESDLNVDIVPEGMSPDGNSGQPRPIGACRVTQELYSTVPSGCLFNNRLIFSALANVNGVPKTIKASEGKAWCDNLTESGVSEWRLPTADELTSLAGTNPGAVLAFLGENPSRLLALSDTPGAFQTVDVNARSGSSTNADTNVHVICVVSVYPN